MRRWLQLEGYRLYKVVKKLTGSGKKCQGTTSVVPKVPLISMGFSP